MSARESLETSPTSAPDRGATDTFQPQRFSPGVRIIATIVLYLLLVPLAKVLEALGLWPQLLARRPRALAGDFGSYRPNAHDVLVCAYGKSGTTWALQIAVQIVHRGRASFTNVHDLVAWPDAPGKVFPIVALEDQAPRIRCPTGLRVIKTHLPMQRVPYGTDARYVCVTRDPKDVFVSSYYFVRSLLLGPAMPRVANWLQFFLSPQFTGGSWAEHLASYWSARQRSNMLVLTYEQMKADLPNTVRSMATFLNVELTPAELQEVIHRSSFLYMQQHDSQFRPTQVLPWSKTNGSIVRRGKPGSGTELLSSAQQRRVDDYFRAELLRLGCDFPYDEAFAQRGTQRTDLA
jgi:hypothetical protein